MPSALVLAGIPRLVFHGRLNFQTSAERSLVWKIFCPLKKMRRFSLLLLMAGINIRGFEWTGTAKTLSLRGARWDVAARGSEVGGSADGDIT